MLKLEQLEEVFATESKCEKNHQTNPTKKRRKTEATARDVRNFTEKREQDLQ